MEYLIKPLTKNMLASLQRARAIEVSGNGKRFCTSDDFKGSLSGLYKRGFVITRKVILDGKEIVGVFLTESGINFLNKYEQDLKNWEVNTIVIE